MNQTQRNRYYIKSLFVQNVNGWLHINMNGSGIPFVTAEYKSF